MTIDLLEFFQTQKTAYVSTPFSNLGTRLDRQIALLMNNADELADALAEDYRHRSATLSLMVDVMGTLALIKRTRKILNRIMPPFYGKRTKRIVRWYLNRGKKAANKGLLVRRSVVRRRTEWKLW